MIIDWLCNLIARSAYLAAYDRFACLCHPLRSYNLLLDTSGNKEVDSLQLLLISATEQVRREKYKDWR